MANTSIFGLAATATLANGDVIPVVDVSDTAQSANGSTRKVTLSNLSAFVLASPTLTGTPTAPTAAANTNTTQIATTAFVFAERANTITLTNKTISLTSNTVSGTTAEFNTALSDADFYVTGGTDVAVADGGTGASTAANARTNLGAAASGAVTASGITMSTARLLGRSTASTGAIEEITIGTNLALSGGVLNASSGSPVTLAFAGTALTLNAANKATYQNSLIEFSSATDVVVTIDASFHSGQVAYRQIGAGVVSTVTTGGAVIGGDTPTTIGPGAFVLLVPSATANEWTCIADKSSPAPTSWTPYVVTNSYGTYKVELLPVATDMVHPDTGNVGWATVHGNGETRTGMTLAGETAFTASISGTVMTVTAVGIATNPNGSTLAGVLQTGHYLSGNGILDGTYITSRGTGTGLTGTYNVSQSQTVASGSCFASHKRGVGGVWDRYLDTYSGDGSAEGSRYCWRSTVNPAHIVTNGRPRANIQSHSLDLYRWYRFEFSLRLHQHSSNGWADDSVPIVQTGIGGITQDSGNYGAGQNVTSGPLGLVMRGTRLYALIRGIEAGMGSADQGGYVNWDTGDQSFINENWPFQIMSGLRYHEISMEFFLDPRAIRDGGQGQITVTFDRKPWFTWRGPTCYPNAQNTLVPGPVQVWAGQYETSAGALSAGSLISAVPSCTIERSINYRFPRLMIGK